MEFAVAARPNAALFTSGRVRCLQQGHAFWVVLLVRPAEGCVAGGFGIQPGLGLDEEVQDLVKALVCGLDEGCGSFLLVG